MDKSNYDLLKSIYILLKKNDLKIKKMDLEGYEGFKSLHRNFLDKNIPWRYFLKFINNQKLTELYELVKILNNVDDTAKYLDHLEMLSQDINSSLDRLNKGGTSVWDGNLLDLPESCLSQLFHNLNRWLISMG